MSILLTLCMVLILLPMTASAAAEMKDGWYYIRCMNNYLNVDANGNIELRDKTNTSEGNTKFLVIDHGLWGFNLQTVNGKYVGIEITEEAQANSADSSKYLDDTWLNGQRVKK